MSHTTALLYAPPDVEEACDTWNASCGPTALAAVLRTPVQACRAYFPGIEHRGYVNPTHMQAALRLAGAHGWICAPAEREELLLTYGLAFLCFTGPWTKPGVPIAAQYTRSHWVGCGQDPDYGRMAYDINASTRSSPQGAWVPWHWWQAEILPELVRSYTKADGGYLVRWACEVEGQL